MSNGIVCPLVGPFNWTGQLRCIAIAGPWRKYLDSLERCVENRVYM